MINTKQRAFLRGIANNLTPVMQIGKVGAKETSYKEIENLLEARELIKIKVLPNCDLSAKEIANDLSLNTKCDIIQTIGNKIVLFRVSSKDGFKHLLED